MKERWAIMEPEKGVGGEGTIKGEFADCKGVPAFVSDVSRFCWSICGEEC